MLLALFLKERSFLFLTLFFSKTLSFVSCGIVQKPPLPFSRHEPAILNRRIVLPAGTAGKMPMISRQCVRPFNIYSLLFTDIYFPCEKSTSLSFCESRYVSFAATIFTRPSFCVAILSMFSALTSFESLSFRTMFSSLYIASSFCAA